MQQILGYMRKAILDYKMIENGDTVAIGVSGGKDSVALVEGLSRLRAFIGIQYDILAITIDPCFHGQHTDFSQITQLCQRNHIPHIIKRSELGEIVFNIRNDSSPCSLCARMRRGMLHDIMKAQGANKLALGHHYNDAVETFVMNLFYEGRVGCFSPVTYLSRKDIHVIRPLIFAPERDIISNVRRAELPIVKSSCPVDGATSREATKQWLAHMEKSGHCGITKRIFGAICRGHISGW